MFFLSLLHLLASICPQHFLCSRHVLSSHLPRPNNRRDVKSSLIPCSVIKCSSISGCQGLVSAPGNSPGSMDALLMGCTQTDKKDFGVWVSTGTGEAFCWSHVEELIWFWVSSLHRLPGSGSRICLMCFGCRAKNRHIFTFKELFEERKQRSIRCEYCSVCPSPSDMQSSSQGESGRDHQLWRAQKGRRLRRRLGAEDGAMMMCVLRTGG